MLSKLVPAKMDLLQFIPDGHIDFTRADDGTWAVAAFIPGTSAVAAVIATGMDKNAAALVAHILQVFKNGGCP